MSPAQKAYIDAQREAIRARKDAGGDWSVFDQIEALKRMDDLWWELTEEERVALNEELRNKIDLECDA